MTETSSVDYVLDGKGIATVSLNRPERLNAFNVDLVNGINDSLVRARLDGAKVVVLRGNGKAFCAGADLKEDNSNQATLELFARVDNIQKITQNIQELHVPVVAAVHGYAVGAGCELALLSDLVIAAQNARFRFPEVSVGLSITGGIASVLPKAVGLVKAKELVFLGEYFDANTAYELGLVNNVVPDDELDEAALDLAFRLTELPQTALVIAKRLLNYGGDMPITSAMAFETALAGIASASSESQDARQAFRTHQDKE